MDSLNLCIDIGNTRTKAALYNLDEEVGYYPDLKTEELVQLLKIKDLMVCISKSGENNAVEDILKLKDKYNIVSNKSRLPIRLNYKTPETLGSDRIATAVAAWQQYPRKNVLIIDLGTCLTIDLLDKNGTFQGGLIAPGIQMRLDAMHHYTSALPKVEINRNVTFPGKSTAESMQVGACQSVANEINGYIALAKAQYRDLVVVDCSINKMDFDIDHNYKIFAHPKFVLEGLNVIANQHA